MARSSDDGMSSDDGRDGSEDSSSSWEQSSGGESIGEAGIVLISTVQSVLVGSILVWVNVGSCSRLGGLHLEEEIIGERNWASLAGLLSRRGIVSWVCDDDAAESFFTLIFGGVVNFFLDEVMLLFFGGWNLFCESQQKKSLDAGLFIGCARWSLWSLGRSESGEGEETEIFHLNFD